MVGDQQKFNVAMVTLVCKGATGEKSGSAELDGFAKELVPGVTTTSEAMASPEFTKHIQNWIEETNKDEQVRTSLLFSY
jgi:hypothetical protein